MEINNLELIAPLMPRDSGYFCHMQIVCRAKDHKEEKVREGAVKTYFIKDEEHLRRVMPEVILLCEHYGARAYINVSHKSFERLQKLILTKIASLIYEGNVQNPRKTLNSAAGELTSKNPIWIIDVDDLILKSEDLGWLCGYYRTEEKFYLIGTIPTKQGCHLLTRPFNLKMFQIRFPNVDVHKNSMGTLLYYPNSIMDI